MSTLPLASFAVAVRPELWPAVNDSDVGETVTDATAACATVTVIVADTPPIVTVIVADPAATAVTTPLDETVATLVFELLHDAASVVITSPYPSFAVAVSCDVWPAFSVTDVGDKVTDATGAAMRSIVEMPDFPPIVAVMVVVPKACAVARPPVAVIVATPVLDEVQVPLVHAVPPLL